MYFRFSPQDAAAIPPLPDMREISGVLLRDPVFELGYIPFQGRFDGPAHCINLLFVALQDHRAHFVGAKHLHPGSGKPIQGRLVRMAVFIVFSAGNYPIGRGNGFQKFRTRGGGGAMVPTFSTSACKASLPLRWSIRSSASFSASPVNRKEVSP